MKLELQTISKKLSPRLKAYKPARADVENFAQNLEFYLNHIDSKETEENLKTHFMGLLKPTYQPSHTIEQYGDIDFVIRTDLGAVVNRHHKRATDAFQLVCHPLKSLPVKQALAIVILAPEIRWVEVKQRLGMVIARDQIAPVEVLEHHPVKPLVRGIQQWPKLDEAETRCAGGRNAKDGIDLAAKAQTLQVQKPRRTLEVGQMCGIGLAQLLEPAARDDLKPQHVHELRIVALQDAKEVDDLAVAVVHHLKARLPRPAQKHAAHADEGLNIGAVGDAIDARRSGSWRACFCHPASWRRARRGARVSLCPWWIPEYELARLRA